MQRRRDDAVALRVRSGRLRAHDPDGSGGSSGEVPDGGEGEEELVSDGGTEPPPEDDGGLTDPDAGLDAGPACQALKTGAFVTTTCSTLPARVLAGGPLTTTTYELTSVTVLGSSDLCKPAGGYAVREHRGTLRVTASSGTSATFEFIDQFRVPGSLRVSSRRWDTQIKASDNILTLTPQACSINPAPATAAYGVGTSSGKKTINLRLPWRRRQGSRPIGCARC